VLYPAVALFVLALVCALFLRHGWSARALFLTALLGLILSLVAQSPARPVGDSREYVAMAQNLARFDKPSATETDLAGVRALFPSDAGEPREIPQLRAPDGRQDFPHFWFYSLLAAPFVGVAQAFGANPVTGFAALNIALLIGLAAWLIARGSMAVALFVVAGPILWWVDKAHSEVLTVSMIAIGLLELRDRPWWSIVAFGVAATQNPPIAGAMILAIGFAFYKQGWSHRKVWIAAVAGLFLAALHPLYFYARLRVWTGLYDAVDPHWPSFRELTTVLIDPNLGILVHDPLAFAAMAIALLEVVTRPRPASRQALRSEAGVDSRLQADLRSTPRHPPSTRMVEGITFGLLALLFLVSFTQTTNFNSGGTPDPSRYGLWLVPFAIPILSGVPASARWMKVLAAGSVAWCIWAFAPELPDQYLRPTTFAADLWRRWPALDNPIAEVFAERTSGHEPARPPIATSGCEKVLLWGDGSGAAWPQRCTAAPLPGYCQVKDALCYANRVGETYGFVPAQASPAWRTEITRDHLPRSSGGMLAIAQPTEPRVPMAIWQGDGWSYPERLTVPATDVISREWRWIGDRADIGVMTAEPMRTRMTIVARALSRPRRLRVSIGDVEIATVLVAPERGEYQTSSFTLPSGTSTIALESLDGSDAAGSGDPRRLSVAVFRVELVATR
jgi:hypothetical protein